MSINAIYIPTMQANSNFEILCNLLTWFIAILHMQKMLLLFPGITFSIYAIYCPLTWASILS